MFLNTMGDTTVEKKAHRKRVGGLPYSTELLRRKRHETNVLRLEAEALSVQLKELQRLRRETSTEVTLARSCPSVWRPVAATESAKRVRSQKTNRELKALLTELTKIRDPVLKTLIKTNALQDMDFVFQLPEIERPPPQVNFSETVLEEMTSSLDWLRLDTDTMLPVLDDNITVSFRWQDVPSLNCIQASSITPIFSRAEEIGEMIWRHARNTNKQTDEAFRYIRRKAPTPIDMNAVALMVEGLLCNNVISTYRKYDEGDRIIIVGTTKWFLPSGEFVLQDYNWTVISPTATAAGEMCVMRHYYKLEMATTSSEEAAQAQQPVFRAVCSKMRNLHQVMQDKLLSNENSS
ncbi:hypothetical protein P3T76_006021 [Phytophthora citrophthora]|uniref:M96 mating-specific protein family n=1 Tax=Phytophthora citrophthora TaxID=4793 RepID=A0AAD9GPY1_9STRA|nr:hypothetical protein P3T76_006021 [Phytophthora citrophthora]